MIHKLYEMSVKGLITDQYDIPVIIYHNDEAGIWQWSISVVDYSEKYNGFWINSFESLEESLNCLEKNPGLTLQKILP